MFGQRHPIMLCSNDRLPVANESMYTGRNESISGGRAMQTILRVAFVVASSLCLTVPALAGPFGLTRGMTRDQIIALVGKDSVVKETPNSIGGELLKLRTVPKPHHEFEAYNLFISKEDGLLKIVAVGVDISSSSDGAEVRRDFSEMRSALVANYSNPVHDFDFVKAGSIWDKPEDFMMGLLKQERILSSAWILENGSSLRDDLSIVAIEASGLSSEKAYLTLTYEFKGWEAYVERVKAKESSVL